MNAPSVQAEPGGQKAGYPAPPGNQQHGDHRTAHSVEQEGGTDDVLAPESLEP